MQRGHDEVERVEAALREQLPYMEPEIPERIAREVKRVIANSTEG